MESLLYRERVLPSFATYLLAPTLGAMVTALSIPTFQGFAYIAGSLAALLLVFLLTVKAPVIEVSGELLKVGRAQIAHAYLGKVSIISPDDAFAERGHKLDARAFTSFQSSVRTLIKVELLDKTDPTPYWLFSTRNPEDLAKTLDALHADRIGLRLTRK